MSPRPRDEERRSERREIWGDDPEERDASAVVKQYMEGGDRPWHDHGAIVPFKVVGRFIARNGKRLAVTILGFVVLLAGVAMLVLPGPGIGAIFLGLTILSTEYVWAQRLLRKARVKFGEARDAVLRRKKNDPEAG